MPKNVLVTVLDWGLGHATRCVPVIRELKKQNFNVVIGGSGASLNFLKEEFEGLKFYELPSYNIKYTRSGTLMWSLISQLPGIVTQIKTEHKRIQEIIEEENISCILSDNRYGCYSPKVKSIFICHQLNLQLPTGFSLLSGIVNYLHLQKIKPFQEIWIPDEEKGFRYSGILSTNSINNVRYIGILSRFNLVEKEVDSPYEIVAIVSGPEPQRSIFENILRDQLIKLNRNSILIKGKPGSSGKIQNGRLTEVDHLNSKALELVLMNSSLVVCRSGYSSIMDLAVLGKKVIFVPTPGQTEQEYLAKYFQERGEAISQSQEGFNLKEALTKSEAISLFPISRPNSNLANVILSI